MIKPLKQLYTKVKNLLAGNTLKSRVGRSSIWIIVGFTSSTFVRMAGSLILTRIFVPEVFGLMAIISAIIVGLELLSDVGINASVIRHPKGEEVNFLKTAWTLKLIRGCFLWIILFLLSNPIAELYKEPDLAIILPIIGITMLLKGASSTSLLIYQRRLLVKEPIVLELVAQVLGLLMTISLALIYGNIWAFVIGWIFSVFITFLGSYFYLNFGINGLLIHKSYLNDIVKFGKWILFATILTYCVGLGDRLILGLLISKTQLGLYNLATMFSQLTLGVFLSLSAKMIMPTLSELVNLGKTRTELSLSFDKIRRSLLLLLIPLLVFISVFGSYIIGYLYSDAYQQAGWMLQILATGAIVQIVCFSITPIFLAKGDSFYHMISNSIWAVLFISFMLIGHYFYGMLGMVIGISIAPLVWLPIISLLARKYVEIDGLFNFKVISISLGIVFITWYLVGISI
jgi:O-antigen/teichoic acid export membrane protein